MISPLRLKIIQDLSKTYLVKNFQAKCWEERKILTSTNIVPSKPK